MSGVHTSQQYRGRVTPAQAAEGIHTAVENAKSLIADAELLLENQRWPRACALAILAIEELGKEQVLQEILLVQNDSELLKEAWRKYISHPEKNQAWIIPSLIGSGARTEEDFRPFFVGKRSHALNIELMKRSALYTDAYGKCNWSSPFSVITESRAKSIVATAKSSAQSAPGPLSTQAGLELWMRYMQPVYGKSIDEYKAALLACFREAREKGIWSGEETEQMLKGFLGLE